MPFSRASLGWALGFCVATFLSQSKADELTTIFVVRHAEKSGDSGDVPLTKAGWRRAAELADVFSSYRLSAVYSTRFKRTQQTAEPTARAAQLEITPYDNATQQWANSVLAKNAGGNVLIVGHSNTVGAIVELLSGEDGISVGHDEFDRLFVVRVRGEARNVLAMRYGPLETVGQLQFDGQIIAPEEISGIAATQEFLVIGADEGVAIQVLKSCAASNRYTAADPIPLIEVDDDDDKEIDIEGIARSDNTYFVLGSHSRKRQKVDPNDAKSLDRKYKKNRKRLEKTEPEKRRNSIFRLSLNPDSGQRSSEIDQISLDDFLRQNKTLKPFYEIASKENGIDFEGIATDGNRLFVGCRGPVLRLGFVPILTFSFDAPENTKLLYVNLDGLGVRDMVRVSDGFLIVAGPVGDIPHRYRLYHWDGRDCLPGTDRDTTRGTITLLGSIPTAFGVKAEGITVMEENDDDYKLLVVYDSARRGNPTLLRVAKP
ncbi:MAG: DUF3616 domain-containing protein [Planctomycetes bacterium]|nr:DUF3616 domain-containing protein [Planctomycetota bacterium]